MKRNFISHESEELKPESDSYGTLTISELIVLQSSRLESWREEKSERI